MSAIDPLDSSAVDDSLQQIADVLDDGELPWEIPEDGWTWTDETRSDMRHAAALMVQALEILKGAAARETPRFYEWDRRTTQPERSGRGNVVPIR
ncbi:MAG TPA: hypothetical protein VGV09_20075 [Steroidobacteraceae bacterium]|nr:hypothetical protein [Steroidobacteraceae bacterium]